LYEGNIGMADSAEDKAKPQASDAEEAGEEGAERTLLYEQPIFPPGYAAGPQDGARILAAGGPQEEQAVTVTGQERFEHMLLYCLSLLQRAKGKICAFYIEDFPDCDEFTMRVLQRMIGRSGYVTSDFIKHATGEYTGFWAWLPRDATECSSERSKAQEGQGLK
jgi:hypothetical protein